MKAVMISLLLMILTGCASTETSPLVAQRRIDYSGYIKNFLHACEEDLRSSTEVIAERRLVSSLSHLNRMGAGGNYYYVLEQKVISDMLNELASYTYSECFIIDTSGKIVYTMYSDVPLGKQVSYYKSLPVTDMFHAGMRGETMIADVTRSPIVMTNYDIYFSRPVIRKGAIEGVLITAVGIKNMEETIPASFNVVASKSGKYKIHSRRNLIDTEDRVFLKVVEDEETGIRKSVRYDDGLYSYYPFEYKTLSWVVVVKEEKKATALNRIQ